MILTTGDRADVDVGHLVEGPTAPPVGVVGEGTACDAGVLLSLHVDHLTRTELCVRASQHLTLSVTLRHLLRISRKTIRQFILPSHHIKCVWNISVCKNDGELFLKYKMIHTKFTIYPAKTLQKDK